MRIRVEGQQPLSGGYRPSGSVNAALPALAAALLTDQPVVLRGAPESKTFIDLLRLAERLGARIERPAPDVLSVQNGGLLKRVLTVEDTQSSVGSILFLAPLLIQRQHARYEVDFPLNRIRTHIEALRDLGLDVRPGDNAVECKSVSWQRKEIVLTQASVTATALVMMLAACLGEETIIHNAACEPHVQTLAHMLVEMGAQIEGIGSNILTVHGMRELVGTQVDIPPDHIETASVAAIAAMSRGRLQIEGVRTADLRMIGKVFARLGIQFDLDVETLFVPKHENLVVSNREEDVDASIETGPWPAFPSDLVAMVTVIATQARGTSLIHEKMFNNRLVFVDKLKAMGAQIVLCDPHRALVVGPTPLRATYFDSPDVRTGFGLLAAALVAEGTTDIDNAETIETTFAAALGKLKAVNARITFV